MSGYAKPQCYQLPFLSPSGPSQLPAVTPQPLGSSPSVSPSSSEGFEAPSTSERCPSTLFPQGIPTPQSRVPQIQHKGTYGLSSHSFLPSVFHTDPLRVCRAGPVLPQNSHHHPALSRGIPKHGAAAREHAWDWPGGNPRPPGLGALPSPAQLHPPGRAAPVPIPSPSPVPAPRPGGRSGGRSRGRSP